MWSLRGLEKAFMNVLRLPLGSSAARSHFQRCRNYPQRDFLCDPHREEEERERRLLPTLRRSATGGDGSLPFRPLL